MEKPPLDSISLSQEKRVDAICSRFEAEFRAGNRPKIEAFLDSLPAESRETYIRELLRVELDLRSGIGETILVDDYLRRFPGQEQLVRQVFAAANSRDRAPPPRPVSKVPADPKVSATVSQADASIQTSQTGQQTTPPTAASAETPVPKAFGRYRIEKELGKGAMGVVYLAEDTQLHRKVALKIPKKSILDEPEALERFYREARTTATLRHNNICPVFDVGAIDGTHYLTMAYIPGKPISGFLGKGKLPSAKQVALLIRKIALPIEEAHKNGIIHRDLKPSNVMLDDRGEPVVMDFGLARQTNSAENARLTQSGAILGTPAYMAPEQVNGDLDQIGPQSDIYALGVMLYQFLTGDLPFNGPILSVFAQILRDQPKRPSEIRPDVDPTLEAICLKMMAKDRAQRYGSMKEVAAALTEYLKPAVATSIASRAPEVESLPIIVTDTNSSLPARSRNTKASGDFSWTRGRLAIIGSASLGLLLLLAVIIIIIEHPNGTKTKVETDAKTITIQTDSDKTAVPPDKAASQITDLPKNSLDRELAELVIQKNGMVSFRTKSKSWSNIDKSLDLPDEPFDLYDISSFEAPGLADEDLKRVVPIAEKLTLLRLCNIGRNQKQLTASGLKAVSQMKNLNGLVLTGGGITKEMLDAVGTLPALETLSLANTSMKDDWLNSLQRFPRLSSLDIGITELSSAGVERLIQQLPNLAELRVQRLPLTEHTVLSISSRSNLKTLFLEGPDCTDQALETIGRMQQLQKFIAHGGDSVTDVGVAHLCDCKTLVSLSLEGTAVTDAAFAHLAKLPRLMTLWINTTSVTPEGIASFRELRPNCVVYWESPDRAAAKWLLSLPRSHETPPVGVQLKTGMRYIASSEDLPEEPFELSYLNLAFTLNLPGKDLAARLKPLSQLVHLRLAKASLSEELMDVISRKTSLEWLEFVDAGTRFGDSELAQLVSLSRLNYLGMFGSDATDAGLKHVAKLENLRTLLLNRTRITDAGLSELAPLQKLTDLQLSETKIGNDGIRNLEKIPGLKTLTLWKTKITDQSLQQLGQMTSLTYLDLSDTDVSDPGIMHLSKLSALKHLRLAGTKVTPAGMTKIQQAIPGCKVMLTNEPATNTPEIGSPLSPKANPDRAALEWLLAMPRSGDGENQKTGIVIRVVGEQADRDILDSGELPSKPFHLIKIQLGRFPTGDQLFSNSEFVDRLSGVTHLREVALFGSQVSPGVISRLCENPELERAIIRDSLPNIADRDFVKLAALRNLRILNIMESELTDAGLSEICHWQQLQELWISDNKQLTAAGLIELQNLKSLKNLCINGLPVNRDVFRALRNSPLDQLQVYRCQLNEADCAELGNISTLERLYMHGATITDEGLKHLKKLKKLRELDVSETQVTAAGITDFKKSRPDCAIHGSKETSANTVSSQAELAQWATSVDGWVQVASRGKLNVMTWPKTIDPWPEGQEIRVIRLRGKTVGDAELDRLAAAPLLYSVDLYETSVTSAGLQRLLPRKLTSLLLTESELMDDAALLSIRRMEMLDTLYIRNLHITDQGLANLAEMPRLSWLSIVGTGITSKGLKHLANFPKLESLEADAQLFDETGVSHLRQVSRLKRIHVDADQGVLQRITTLENLQVISLLYQSELSANDIEVLSNCKFLQNLTLTFPVTEAWVPSLSKLQQLGVLNINDCLITSSGRKKLREALPKCMVSCYPEEPVKNQ